MSQHRSDNLTPAVKEVILALLRSSLWGQSRFPFQAPENTDWNAVYTELKHQTVQNLCVDLLAASDPANALGYIQNAAINIRKWHRIMDRQQNLIEMMNLANIPCVVLKGAAVDRYYPQPEYRCMGDIDLIVHPDDFNRALALFQPPWKILSKDPRHIEIQGNGILVELHHKFASFRSPELCHFLDQHIYEGITRPETLSLKKYSFSCLPKEINGLVLLTHINSHMERGLGLRQMIDWMMFADKELDDNFWQTEFSAATRHLGLEKLAVTVTRMCQLYLGLREDITWCHCADAELCGELLDHTFRQGNFGSKLPKNINIAVGVFSTAKNVPGFFREMQCRGMITWPAAKKHPVLRPFAWLHQIFRYIRLGLKQKNPIRYLSLALSSEKKQGSLLDRLEVSRMNNEH